MNESSRSGSARARAHVGVGALIGALVLGAAPSARAETMRSGDALAEAMAKNPTLAGAIADAASAQALVRSEESRYDPVLEVGFNVTHTKTPSLTFNGVLAGTSDVIAGTAELTKRLRWGTEFTASAGVTSTRSAMPIFVGTQQTGTTPLVLTLGPGYLFSAKLGVTQPLLRGSGRDVTLAALDQAVAQKTSAERERERQASLLARDVLTAYWELWYATRAEDVDRVARETTKRQRDDAQARMETGSIAKADVLTFETQLATKDETVIQSVVDRRARSNELARLLGREVGTDDIAVDATVPPTPADLPGDLSKRALERSPEVTVRAAAVNVAQVKERTAADPYRARLDLDAYVQAQGLGNDEISPAISQLTGLGALSARVGLTYELPLSADRRRAEEARAHSATESARSTLEATQQSLVADVVSAKQKRDAARDRIALAEKSVKLAEDQLAAEKGRFESGSGTALQVIQAQDQVQAANKRLARARADLAQSHLTLAHLVGALVDEVAGSVPRAKTASQWRGPLLGQF